MRSNTTELCFDHVKFSKTLSFITKELPFLKNAFFLDFDFFCSSHNFFHNGRIDPFEVSIASCRHLVLFLQPLSTMTLLYEAVDSFLMKYIGLLTKFAGDWVTSSLKPKHLFRGLGASRAQKDPEFHKAPIRRTIVGEKNHTSTT